MTAVAHLFRDSPRARNQALAYIYRAQDILAGSGIPVEVVTGTTDEGEHWIVACDPDTHNVLAHVAIINGEVIADSAAFARPFRTRNIQDALDRVMRALRIESRELMSGTNGLVALLVAAAVLHLTHADAALLPPLDLDGHDLPAFLIEHLPSTILIRAALAIANAADEAVEHFRAALHQDDAPLHHDTAPLLDFHDNVNLDAVDHRYQPMHEIRIEAEHRTAPMETEGHVSPPTQAPVTHHAPDTSAHVAHQDITQAQVDAVTRAEAPSTQQVTVTSAEASAIVMDFVHAAHGVDIAPTSTADAITIYGYGVDGSETITRDDGVTINLVGVEDTHHQQAVASAGG